jgi:hypothetical protein
MRFIEQPGTCFIYSRPYCSADTRFSLRYAVRPRYRRKLWPCRHLQKASVGPRGQTRVLCQLSSGFQSLEAEEITL